MTNVKKTVRLKTLETLAHEGWQLHGGGIAKGDETFFGGELKNLGEVINWHVNIPTAIVDAVVSEAHVVGELKLEGVHSVLNFFSDGSATIGFETLDKAALNLFYDKLLELKNKGIV